MGYLSRSNLVCQSSSPLIHVENYNPDLVDRALVGRPEPFIFSNSIASWQALNLWSPAFFKEKYGDLEVAINPALPEKVSPYELEAKSYTKILKVSDFINLMLENKSCYLAQEDINTFENLQNYYNLSQLIPTSKNAQHKTLVNLWMGNNTRSGLHFDLYDNFLIQIYGIKKVALISPSDSKFLYPIPNNFLKSPLNPFEPDLIKYPKFKKAKIFEGEIEPGQVLFIPKGWYHYIFSPSQSISLNSWYGPSIELRKMAASLYRAGWKSWLTFIKDFVYHGILARPFELKLYSPPLAGKIAYDLLRGKFHL